MENTKIKKKTKQDKIFDRFMEDNLTIAYKLNKMGYEIKKKGGK